MFPFKNKKIRRFTGAALILAGGLLMWLAPETGIGVILFSAGIVTELVGIWLERERRQ